MQKYTFFFNQQAIRFATNPLFEGISCSEKNIIKGENIDFFALFETLSQKSVEILCGKGKDFLLDQFTNYFKLVEAAGGLVRNEKQEYLFIFRRGKWDLPKGKIDAGEQPPEAALREVEEECGLSELSLKEPLGETFHIYFEKNVPILKKTYWFNMNSSSLQKLIPQTEEQITEVCWLPVSKFPEIKKNTYPNIEMILNLVETGEMKLGNEN